MVGYMRGGQITTFVTFGRVGGWWLAQL